ncbi:hypothetical protein [Paraburkholderia gardini]|uniref:hypothetical protein n=1 Tax=Paraburkholderia gardini TaxID=2823469 RepID=UPI001DA4E31A|nr:hypothetical protein [Paraburkholderia gardini]CAG4889582.1 hypothetical protein R69919_00776 [Paraburkholderia gardini]
MTEREQFETWAKTCGYKLDKFTDNSSRQWYVDKKTAAAFDGWQASRRVALEESAKACDEIASDCWSLYKGRAPYTGREPGRADPGVQGESDGADKCAVAIRKLATETNNG